MDLFGEEKTIEKKNAENLNLIPGLSVIYDFINREEEISLMKEIDNSTWLDDLSRKVQHYGYKYDYKARKISLSSKIGEIPQWMSFVLDRLISTKLIGFSPDQAIINNYEVGQGIASHIDCEPCFADTILSLSLESGVVMEFRSKENITEAVPLYLKPRSIIMLKDKARYDFQHGIAARKSDTFNGNKILRKRRVSITFRKVILM